MIELLPAMILFGFACAISPGPNTVMITASGSAFGFTRSIPHMLGIIIGFPLLVIAAGLGLGEIFTRFPIAHTVLKYAGAAYLLYLAWRIAQAGGTPESAANARPLNFFEAAGFQWINPKAWVIVLSAIPAFTSVGGNYHAELLVLSLVMGLVTIPSLIVWCLFGVGIRQLVRSPRAARVLNLILAASVALSVVLLFI